MVIPDWIPPAAESVKLNCDASKLHNDDSVGFGCAIRDNIGDWQRGCAGTIQVASVLEGELFAIYKGLLLAWEAGFKQVDCETDCHEAY
ncbi:hypothetical protein PIB30_115342, partial [Stylosanthes scabra]|nr:hypothetical protein [Stylosanthes scabra]